MQERIRTQSVWDRDPPAAVHGGNFGDVHIRPGGQGLRPAEPGVVLRGLGRGIRPGAGHFL